MKGEITLFGHWFPRYVKWWIESVCLYKESKIYYSDLVRKKNMIMSTRKHYRSVSGSLCWSNHWLRTALARWRLPDTPSHATTHFTCIWYICLVTICRKKYKLGCYNMCCCDFECSKIHICTSGVHFSWVRMLFYCGASCSIIFQCNCGVVW